MNPEILIKDFIASQSEPKKSDLNTLHAYMQDLLPNGKLWFDSGINEQNKVVTNPTIGYGLQRMNYANGTTKDFFQIGISANATGISVYILGLKDKEHLSTTFGKTIGKAKVTGYCIRFKSLKDIQLEVLKAAILHGIQSTKMTIQ